MTELRTKMISAMELKTSPITPKGLILTLSQGSTGFIINPRTR